MIKISVITITYQAEQVLRRTTESVLQQAYPCVEHLIIDGASTDDTLSMAFEYKFQSDKALNGHTVHIVSEPDNGIYDAMNKGLQQATGDYIVFLNAGDCFPNSHTLNTIVDKTTGDVKPAVIYGDTDIIDENGTFLYHRKNAAPEKLSWQSFRKGMLVCHQAFYARADLAKATDYDLQYRYSADVDWCIRVMKEAEKRNLPLVNVHEVVANYLEEGQTTRHHQASLNERFQVMRHHYGLVTTVLMHLLFVVRAIFKR